MGAIMYPRALTIAGSDSGGGAGIQADLKTFHSLGVYGMSAITALTAQNTRGVQAIHNVPPDFLALQIHSVLDDIGADAAKTGMLSTAPLVRAVANTLRNFHFDRLVVDPVMVSKHGDQLLYQDAITTLISDLLPICLIITPNIHEALLLADLQINDLDSMKEAARRIHRLGPKFVVIKGGHLPLPNATDLFFDGTQMHLLEAPRISSPHTHGTGCTFSAAITAFLARGESPLHAVRLAKQFTTSAIRHAQPLGHGIGPVNLLAPRHDEYAGNNNKKATQS
jgi:hydroxymethylpyrimidine/phosphomethylpyrimidine kinase